MKWRIVLALVSFAPAVLAALRDGRLSTAEAAHLLEQLVGALRPLAELGNKPSE